MSSPHLKSVVRLSHDVPDLWLHRGDLGVVRSIWMSPADWYEVEFARPGRSSVRALLDAQRLEVLQLDPAMTGRETGASHD